jgi:hypothetical protein
MRRTRTKKTRGVASEATRAANVATPPMRDDAAPPASPSQPPYAFLETPELEAIDSEWDSAS